MMHMYVPMLVAGRLLVLSALLLACSTSTGFSMKDIAEQARNTRPLVNACITDSFRGKPRVLTYMMDLQLQNTAAEPRWLIWAINHSDSPRDAAFSTRPGNGQLSSLSMTMLSSEPRAVAIRGGGSDFWAVHLPGHGTLALSRASYRTSFTGAAWPTPDSFEFEILVAPSITVDGKPLESYFDESIHSESGAHGDGPPRARTYNVPSSWRYSKERGVVEFDVESRSWLVLQRPKAEGSTGDCLPRGACSPHD